MKSVSGHILGGKLKNYISCEKEGLTRTEFVNFYRSVINHQKNQNEALTVLFFRVRIYVYLLRRKYF